MKRRCADYVLWIGLLLSGCATNTSVTTISNKYRPEDASCRVQFFQDSKPSTFYEPLAKIESHVQKNLFFGGRASLKDEAYAELRVRACAAGGDGVIVEDYVESTAAEFSHVHVWATAIKLSK